MHKLIEEILTGELTVDPDDLTTRARELLGQLLAKGGRTGQLPA